MTARRGLLDGLARETDIFELVSELAPLHPRNNTFPGEVFLHVAADALNWCGVLHVSVPQMWDLLQATSGPVLHSIATALHIRHSVSDLPPTSRKWGNRWSRRSLYDDAGRM